MVRWDGNVLREIGWGEWSAFTWLRKGTDVGLL
jgi:hypothetical protein